MFAVSYNASHPDEKNGVYVEVDVLDSVMNYGQVVYFIALLLVLLFTFTGSLFAFTVCNREELVCNAVRKEVNIFCVH